MTDIVNPNQLETTVPPEQLNQSIEELDQEKTKTDLINGSKSSYIKLQVFKNHELFWEKLVEDMKSADADIRQRALSEFNKLQTKVLPTELTSPEDGGIVVRVTNFLKESSNNDE